MQKLQRSTFSATQKDALLDQVKLVIDAGEVGVRSDSTDIAHLERSHRMDAYKVTRYTRAIDRLNAQYGWHLDAQKVLSRLGKKLGKKCGGGWIAPEKKCKSHYTNGKLNASGKASGANLADRVRNRKKMSTIASRDGKLAGGSWDIGAGYRSKKETQSTVLARRTSPGGKRTLPAVDRVSNLNRTESERARINWGRTTGDWKQKPDSTAAMDMGKPTLPSVEAIEQKWAKSFTEMADPTPIAKSSKGAKYMVDPQTNEAMRKHEGVKRIAEALDFNEGLIDTGRENRGGLNLGVVKVVRLNPKSQAQRWGSATVEVDRGEGSERINIALPLLADAVKKVKQPTPIESGKSLKTLFTEADRIAEKYPSTPTFAERRSARQEADRIMEESGARAAVDRASGVATMAPVRIPNQRSSKEPRRRGRSVD